MYQIRWTLSKHEGQNLICAWSIHEIIRNKGRLRCFLYKKNGICRFSEDIDLSIIECYVWINSSENLAGDEQISSCIISSDGFILTTVIPTGKIEFNIS